MLLSNTDISLLGAFEDDLLLRTSPYRNQFVLPSKLKPLIYKDLHSEMGHLGPERVFHLAKRDGIFVRYGRRDISSYTNRFLLREEKVTQLDTSYTLKHHHHNTAIRNNRHWFPAPRYLQWMIWVLAFCNWSLSKVLQSMRKPTQQ